MRRYALVVATVLGLTLAACTGDDDGERKRAEAAEWCEVTSHIDAVFNDTDGMRGMADRMPFDQAAEWVDVAPMEIRPSTERAARILRELPTDPPHPELAGARKEIGAYVAEHCPAPAPCISDVERNPRFPCIHPIEARRR